MKHKQQVEMAKAKAARDAYRSPYEKINLIDLTAAWKVIADLDAGLPKIPPEDVLLSEDAKRAIVGLARLVEELRYEWS